MWRRNQSMHPIIALFLSSPLALVVCAFPLNTRDLPLCSPQLESRRRASQLVLRLGNPQTPFFGLSIPKNRLQIAPSPGVGRRKCPYRCAAAVPPRRRLCIIHIICIPLLTSFCSSSVFSLTLIPRDNGAA
ncbi:hypothetical protein L209DRAFT_174576 [Thermothelomyces heterothallicus CBS 203.75]